ncbi:MAG: STAS domain-containing protein [Pseudomonadota bacterium]
MNKEFCSNLTNSIVHALHEQKEGVPALKCHEEAGRLVVVVEGPRLDASISPTFKSDVAALIGRTNQDLVIDFREVSFLDSTALGTLVGLRKQIVLPRRLALRGLAPSLRRIFALTQLDAVFTIEGQGPTGPQAVSA